MFDLNLHCLFIPVCLKSSGKYGDHKTCIYMYMYFMLFRGGGRGVGWGGMDTLSGNFVKIIFLSLKRGLL